MWPGDGVVIERNVRACLGLEPYPAKFPIDVSARLPEKVLEESEEYKVYTDRYGITLKVYKKGTSAPLDLAFPIAGRADFERYKEHYSAGSLAQAPAGRLGSAEPAGCGRATSPSAWAASPSASSASPGTSSVPTSCTC